MDSLTWIVLILSMIGTAMCWVRVIKSDDLIPFKVAGLIVAAIPVVGPFFFLFLDMPPRIPEDARAKLEWRFGTTLYTDIRRELFQGNRRYIGAMFGVREVEDSDNREYRRAIRRRGDRGAKGN